MKAKITLNACMLMALTLQVILLIIQLVTGNDSLCTPILLISVAICITICFQIKNQLPCGRENLSYGSGMWSKICMPA